MYRILTVSFGLLMSTTPAFAAGKICLVDGEFAVNETADGKAAQQRLEALYAAKQGELQKLQADLEKAVTDFQARAMILSDEAKATQQQDLARRQAELQQKAMSAEGEMQETYQKLLADMQAKLQQVAQTVGPAKGCSVLLNKAAVLYAGSDVLDITKDIVTAIDAK